MHSLISLAVDHATGGPVAALKFLVCNFINGHSEHLVIRRRDAALGIVDLLI
jgi:hypothetical protein